ncbi:MAG TPA: hypothetical protein PLS49_03905 [Candidatus Woesebacteria bacterium]|nr:hypothetical protein [Candidatus Woesebacteria bacterium]
MNNKKYIFIIAGLLFIIIILYILISFFIDTDSESTDSAQSPSLMPLQITLPPYKKIETAPTLSPNKGQGIDINSTFIKNSQSELKKLSNSLPYQTSVTSSKGLPIEIVIPQTKFEDNTWTLTV